VCATVDQSTYILQGDFHKTLWWCRSILLLTSVVQQQQSGCMRSSGRLSVYAFNPVTVGEISGMMIHQPCDTGGRVLHSVQP
jgi:hypothetical protein